MKRVAWLLAPDAHQVLFALRFCIAIALALYLSMWLQLERPYWAMLETAVMIQPVPGQAVVRAFARAVGTIVAASVGLLIVALFMQSYELSAAALALWVAFCSFGANLLRNNLSYGFAIGGIICAMVVILSHSTSTPPFEIALMRTLESLLAAGVVATVNVLLSPPTGLRNYVDSRLALLRDLGRELQRVAAFHGRGTNAADEPAASAPEQDPHPPLQALAAQALTLERIRRYVRYETPEFAGLNRLARRLDYDLLSLISAISSLHVYLAARVGHIDARAVAPLAEPAARMHDEPDNPDAAKTAFDTAYERILAIAREPADHGRSRSLGDWVVISRALGIASRARAVMVTHGLLSRAQRHPPAPPRRAADFGEPLDFKHAARNSFRTFVAASAAGALWVNFHTQLPTVILMILVSAMTTILATLPDPLKAARGFVKGLVAAAIVSFVLNFLMFPMANSYAMLLLGVLPVVFVAGLALAMPDPALAGPGRITVLLMSLLLHVQNTPLPGSSIGILPGFTIYFQFLMGIAGAIAITVVAFRLILPVSPRQRLREQMIGVFDELARGAWDSRERFETRMYDRLNTLALSEVDEPYRFSARQAVQASINIGLEARSLMVVARRLALPAELQDAIRHEIVQLRDLLSRRQMHSLEQVGARARALNALAERLLGHALSIEREGERRLGVRAAICAELTASALADYILAFEHGESPLHRDQPGRAVAT